MRWSGRVAGNGLDFGGAARLLVVSDDERCCEPIPSLPMGAGCASDGGDCGGGGDAFEGGV